VASWPERQARSWRSMLPRMGSRSSYRRLCRRRNPPPGPTRKPLPNPPVFDRTCRARRASGVRSLGRFRCPGVTGRADERGRDSGPPAVVGTHRAVEPIGCSFRSTVTDGPPRPQAIQSCTMTIPGQSRSTGERMQLCRVEVGFRARPQAPNWDPGRGLGDSACSRRRYRRNSRCSKAETVAPTMSRPATATPTRATPISNTSAAATTVPIISTTSVMPSGPSRLCHGNSRRAESGRGQIRFMLLRRHPATAPPLRLERSAAWTVR
jgi:hypothetical protein